MRLVMDPPSSVLVDPETFEAENLPGLPPRPAWPPEVEFVISALEAGGNRKPAPHTDRRDGRRAMHRELARLRLFVDGGDAEPWLLFSRDIDRRGMGFITRHRLPLGYGGQVAVNGPDGRELRIGCIVRRCRETVNGWYEGSLSFNREQWAFSGDDRPGPPLRLARDNDAPA